MRTGEPSSSWSKMPSLLTLLLTDTRPQLDTHQDSAALLCYVCSRQELQKLPGVPVFSHLLCGSHHPSAFGCEAFAMKALPGADSRAESCQLS